MLEARRCLCTCSSKPAHVVHCNFSFSPAWQLSNKMYTEHPMHNVQAEGGRHIELMGHNRFLQTAENCSDILAFTSES